MNLQLLTRSLLLTAAAMVETEEVTYTGVLWRAANVRDFIKGTPVEEFTVERELACAAEAQRRSWCTLYCYIGNLCSLYTVTFPPSVFPPVVNCKTMSSLRISCSPPFAPILMLEDLGCLYTSTTKRDWTDSRDDCHSYGAHLFVPSTSEQYTALKNHYASGSLFEWKWVGLTARRWLDGRLEEDVWNSGEPNGPADASQCGLMQPEYSMDDKYCVESYEYVCQVNITSP